MEAINWTKGIDQKTGLPIDYDPKKDIQVYSGLLPLISICHAPIARTCGYRHSIVARKETGCDRD
jgi:hypothetical protein